VSAAPTLIAPERKAFARRARPWPARRRSLLLAVADHCVLIALAIAFLAPLVFIVLTSLMTDRQAWVTAPLSLNRGPDSESSIVRRSWVA